MTVPRTYFSDEMCCIAFWNNVVFVDIDGEMSAPRMRTLAQGYRELLTIYPRIVALCVMRPGTPVSGSEARAESTRFMKELGSSIAHVAMVIESQGIVAQMLRSVIRGINTITRSSSLSIAQNVDEAIRNIVPLVISTSPRNKVTAEVTAALATVRARFRPEQSQAGGIR
jgi:hypothetical protein